MIFSTSGIHNVKSVTVGPIEHRAHKDGQVYAHRTLTVLSEADGSSCSTSITLFGQAEALFIASDDIDARISEAYAKGRADEKRILQETS